MTSVPPLPAQSTTDPVPAIITGWAWLDRWIAHPDFRKVFKFGVVGGTGFVTDAGVLTALNSGLGLDPYTARVIAIIVATIVTWRLNRAFTFGASERSQGHEAMRYALVAAIASGVNWLVYAACVYFTGMMPVLAVVVGCAVAMFVSYTGYNRFVFGAK